MTPLPSWIAKGCWVAEGEFLTTLNKPAYRMGVGKVQQRYGKQSVEVLGTLLVRCLAAAAIGGGGTQTTSTPGLEPEPLRLKYAINALVELSSKA